MLSDVFMFVTLLADKLVHLTASKSGLAKSRDYWCESKVCVMQGLEAAYLTSSHHISKLVKDGWSPYRRSAWNSKALSGTAKEWVSLPACMRKAQIHSMHRVSFACPPPSSARR